MHIDIDWVDTTTLTEITLLVIAFLLSAIIGAERQYHLKAAGLKTHTLVGLGSALFTLVSAYGFQDMVGINTGAVDPSRIAAQVVSGIGFLGAGVIFVRHGSVSGLTTAASIWVTAAIGMACGAGAPLLAIIATMLYLIAIGVVGTLARRFGGQQGRELELVVDYKAGFSALRAMLDAASDHGIETMVAKSTTLTSAVPAGPDGSGAKPARHQATLRLEHATTEDADDLLEVICTIPGVVTAQRVGADFD